eukprot:gene7027-53403_t
MPPAAAATVDVACRSDPSHGAAAVPVPSAAAVGRPVVLRYDAAAAA